MLKPFSKIAGVVLAAGSASRMGATKQLLPFKGKPVLEHVINNARLSTLHEIIVVLGHNADKIQLCVDLSHTITVYNDIYMRGQSTSVIKGLEQVSSECDAVMFLLADQPLVTSDIINSIINAFNADIKPIMIPYYENRRGNPVIIDKSMFHDLKSLSGDTGPRVLFKNKKFFISKVAIGDNSILFDVDTKDDYKKLCKFFA